MSAAGIGRSFVAARRTAGNAAAGEPVRIACSNGARPGVPSSPKLQAAASATVGALASAAPSSAADAVSRIEPNANAASAAIIVSAFVTSERSTFARDVIAFCPTVRAANIRTNGVADAKARSTSVVSARRVSAASSRLAIVAMSSELSGLLDTDAPVDGDVCVQPAIADTHVSATATPCNRQLLVETALQEFTDVLR